MSKVDIPEKHKFLSKVVGALFILFLMIMIGALAIGAESGDYDAAFFKSFTIVTHADVNENGNGNPFLLATLSIMGVVVDFYVVYVFLEFLLEGEINKYFRGAKKMKKISSMKNHYIVCGGGRVGYNVVKELHKHSKKMVIIEKDDDLAQRLERSGFLVIKGDALDDFILLKAGVQQASHMFACLEEDADNLLLVMTAHELNPKIVTGARAQDESIVKKLHHAGAQFVVLPEVVGGVQLAKSVIEGKDD